MSARIAGFKGEYLWELDISEHHLAALAEAIPDGRYDWRPAEGARSVSEVLVHVAGGHFLLLDMIGVPAPVSLFPTIEAAGPARFFELIAVNQSLEKSITSKPDVVRLLHASIDAVRHAFTNATTQELERTELFFGEQTTVRRAYLRMLTHAHEHMGQLIAYTRTMGMNAPWPDPADYVKAERAKLAGGR